MNHFFLLNEAIETPDFEAFKLGMLELNALDKGRDDIFLKHESIYDLRILEYLYTNFGQVEMVISKFIEQLKPTELHFPDEATFDFHYPISPNAFLGIEFATQKHILVVKQITNQVSFDAWKIYNLSNFDKLKLELGNCLVHSDFKRDFEVLPKEVQKSMIEGVKRAKMRNLLTPFYPDTRIIKDVSPKNSNVKVLELRIYSPVALRVYFNEHDGKIIVASVEQKSNPNQNEDIQKAATILSQLIHSFK